MTYASLLGARVERGPAALDIPAPLIDGADDGGGVRLVADRQRALLHVRAVADFAITDGQCVRVDPHPGATRGDVDTYLRGTVAGILLGQRGRFALHASLVRVRETVVALAAFPTYGKSTTALRLAQRGHELIADDFAELRPEADGVVYTTVGRAVHVGPAAAAALGIETAGATGASDRGEKLTLPAPPVASGRLEAIAVLGIGGGEEVAADHLTGELALANVFRHAFRAQVATVLWPAEAFAWAAAIIAQLPVYSVTRPLHAWTVDAVADAVEAIAAQTGTARASRL
jgi:hypothetical protein